MPTATSHVFHMRSMEPWICQMNTRKECMAVLIYAVALPDNNSYKSGSVIVARLCWHWKIFYTATSYTFSRITTTEDYGLQDVGHKLFPTT